MPEANPNPCLSAWAIGLTAGLCLVSLAACSRSSSTQPESPPSPEPKTDIFTAETFPGQIVALPLSEMPALRSSGGVIATTNSKVFFIAPTEPGTFIIEAEKDADARQVASVTVRSPVHPILQFEQSATDALRVAGPELSIAVEVHAAEPVSARAVFSLNNESVLIAQAGPQSGSIVIDGANLSGTGMIAPEEIELLTDLVNKNWFDEIVFSALDFPCADVMQDASLEARAAMSAALLLPFQIILKHLSADRRGTFAAFAEHSACGYRGSAFDEFRPVPNGALITLSRGSAIPMTPGYWLLDGVGRPVFDQIFLPIDGDGAPE